MKLFNQSPTLTRSVFCSTPFQAFIFSRLLILIILVFTTQTKLTGIPGWEGTIHNPTMELSLQDIKLSLSTKLLAADASWYVWIARSGYSKEDRSVATPQNWVFFPLLPLLLRLGEVLTGSYLLAGILISNISLLVALFLVERLGPLLGFSAQSTSRALWLIALCPMSYFYSVPMTESLYLLLLALSLYYLLRDRPILAGLFFALLSATRPTGVLMLPGFALMVLRRKNLTTRQKLSTMLLAPLGALSYMMYLWFLTGDPLVFAKNQAYWGRSEGFSGLIANTITHPWLWSVGWNFILLNALSAILVLVASVFLISKKEFGLSALLSLPIIFALSTGTFQSITRFIMVMFPLFLILGDWIKTETQERICLALSAALLCGMTILYGLSITSAMA